MGNWVCQSCKEPIEGDDGRILIFNTNPDFGPVGGRPVKGTPEVEESGLLDSSPQAMIERLRERHVRGPSIGFSVVHVKCDESSDAPYPITTTQASSLEEWCAWVLDVGGKDWMSRDDVTRMLALWWTHKNQYPPHP